MFQPFPTPARLAMILSGALLVPSVHGSHLKAPAANDPNVQTEALKPFTHIAYIPAQFEPGSIRFENVKMVQVPVTIQRRMDATYCAGLAFRDPGGSAFCPISRSDRRRRPTESPTLSPASPWHQTSRRVGASRLAFTFIQRNWLLRLRRRYRRGSRIGRISRAISR